MAAIFATAGQWAPPLIGAASALLGGGGGGTESIGWGDVFGENDQNMIDLSGQLMDLPGREFYGGQTYADLPPALRNNYGAMQNFGAGGGFGRDVSNNQFNVGAVGQGALNQGSGYLDMMAGRGDPSFQLDMGAFNQVMDNPYLEQMVTAAQQPLSDQFNEVTLPGFNMGRESGGAYAGSRAGLTEGRMRSNFGRDMANIEAGVMNPAYQAAVQAAMTGGAQTLGAGLANDQNFMTGAGAIAGQGLPGYANAFDSRTQGFDVTAAGAGGIQSYEQKAINEAMGRFDYNRDQPWEDVNARISGLPTLSGDVQPGQPGMSWLDTAMQGANLGGNLWNAYQEGSWSSQPSTTAKVGV